MSTTTYDRDLEEKIAKGRSQNALLVALALLFIPALTGLFANGDYRVGGMIGLATALVPALLLRDRLNGRPALAYAIVPAITAVIAYVNAFDYRIGALGLVCGLAAVKAFFAIKDNQDYRPRLLGEKK